MSGRTLATVLLRVFGITLIVGGVAAMGALFLFFAHDGFPTDRAPAMTALFGALVSLIAGIYLLRNGDRLGGWLVSDVEEPSEPPATAADVEGIGVRLLGIYLIISGSRELVRFLAEWLATKEVAHLSAFAISRVAGGLVELLAGVFLLWKREQIVGALSRGWRVIRSQDQE